MHDPFDHLKKTVSDCYAAEREIGTGGLATPTFH